MNTSLAVATIVLADKNANAFELALGLVPDLLSPTILSDGKAFV